MVVICEKTIYLVSDNNPEIYCVVEERGVGVVRGMDRERAIEASA